MAMDKWSEMVGKYRQVCRLRGQAAQPHSCPQVVALREAPRGSFLPEITYSPQIWLRLHTRESVGSVMGAHDGWSPEALYWIVPPIIQDARLHIPIQPSDRGPLLTQGQG